MTLLRLPPVSIEDAWADLALANADLEHACHFMDSEEDLLQAQGEFDAAANRLDALRSQVPVRHMKAWAS